MVTRPLYRLIVGGADVTDRVRPWLFRLKLSDNENDQSDHLALHLSAKFKRPDYPDRIEVWLGNSLPLTFAGLFYMHKTCIRNNRELTITATSVDFNSEIKERRHLRYEQITLASLAETIAKRHGLKVRSDVTQPTLDIDQINESDLNLLNRLAKEHGHIFNIKNATLYYMQREIAPPVVTLNIAQCVTSEITHTNRTWYRSCKAIYQNIRRNEFVTVTVGRGKPCLVKEGHFQDDKEARLYAENALRRANRATAEGRLTLPGRILFAGSRLNLDEQSYVITRVEHSINSDGWLTSIEFNNRGDGKPITNMN